MIYHQVLSHFLNTIILTKRVINIFIKNFLSIMFIYKKKQQGKLRHKRFAKGYIYHYNFFARERYYLRLLFSIVQGSKSFQNLRKVD